VTVNGAKLDNTSGYATIVFKICNNIAKYSVTCKYIYINAEGLKVDDHLDILQSGA
jgi:hypothetical protein